MIGWIAKNMKYSLGKNIRISWAIYMIREVFEMYRIFSEDIYALTCTWSGRFEENTFWRCWVHAEEIFFHEKRNTFYSPPFDMIRRIGRKYILTSPYPRFMFRKFLSRKRKLLFFDFTGDTHDWDRVVLVFLHQPPIPTLPHFSCVLVWLVCICICTVFLHSLYTCACLSLV